jgi:glucose-induced degradation protein 8
MNFWYCFVAADIDLATITDRMEVKRAVQSGNVQEAIEKINDLNPTVLFYILF